MGSQGCGLALLPFRSVLAGSMVHWQPWQPTKNSRQLLMWHGRPGRQGQSMEDADSGLTTSFGLSLGLASLGLLGFDLPPALDFRVGPPIPPHRPSCKSWTLGKLVGRWLV